MKIYFKTAGKNQNQDYQWFIKENEILTKVEVPKGFSDQVQFHYKKNENEVKLYLKVPSSTRKDNWSRIIQNFIYIEGTADEFMMQQLAFIYLTDYNKLVEIMDDFITEEDNDLGFECNAINVDYDLGQSKLYRGKLPQFISTSDEHLIERLSSKIISGNAIEVMETDVFDETIYHSKLIYLSEDISELVMSYKTYLKKMKKKKTTLFAGVAMAAVAVITIISRRKKNE